MDANDSRIFEELRKNDGLGRFVSNPAAEADFEVALQIRQLLKLPHSRYHDYLKFGLARAIVGSTGRKLPTHRKRLEGNFENLLRYHFEGAQERNREVLKRYPFQSSRDRSDIEACIVRAVEVTGRRRDEDKSVDAAIAELCELTIASNLDVAEALQALRSIDGRSFPFQPSVLILRWKIAVSMDAPEANDLRRQLDGKYFDALEWLIDQGMRANSVKWTPTLTRKSEQNEPKP